MWQPNERYPDPAVRVLDQSFNKYRLPLASVERLYIGCRWSEPRCSIRMPAQR